MELIISAFTTLLVTATPLPASNGMETIGTSMLDILFLFFLALGVLIVVCQLIPSLVHLCFIMKETFRGTVKTHAGSG